MDIAADSSLRIRLTNKETIMNKKTIYFGYGSNLWLYQMRQRCPTSKYLGIARLKGYKWIIYDRGYANIVEVAEDEQSSSKHDYSEEVWGLVYSLEEEDERRLDRNEGVPVAYQKELIECEYWTSAKGRAVAIDSWEDRLTYERSGRPDTSKDPEKVDMLVYIDRTRTKSSEPKKEYIYRMNMGIHDALYEGVPKEYVEQVMRKFIPERNEEDLIEVARRQALEFEDEDSDDDEDDEL
ncbi:hypothetical protein HII31_06020 [Pseudocercospora fuligena]|uniref:gamma-glutamylcyclotransferase n=1 Tax=Pseudocercospora fuligena TaxID=685502 RepID=A0A8H6RHM4_9PEZI|nr:hypothetical protein HII31_06020 [Pseudocercospora fuligena]